MPLHARRHLVIRHLTVLIMCLMLACTSVPGGEPPVEQETVVLLHGLGRTRFSMRSMANSLQRHGYRTLSVGYPSRKETLAPLVEGLARDLDEAGIGTAGHGRVHFVTHSAGGILARAFLARHPDYPVGKLVMLSPPNQGSQLAAKLSRFAVVKSLTGPLAEELAAGPESLPPSLPVPTYPVGVITGNRSGMLGPLSKLISGDDDGIVGVREAGFEGMTEFLVVPRSHTFIMNSRSVQELTRSFLRTGRFQDPLER